MERRPTPPTQSQPTLVGTLQSWAGKILTVIGDLAVAYDALPLEQKYPFKQFLIAISKKNNPDFHNLLLKEEKELDRVIRKSGWSILPRDITCPIQRKILTLDQNGESGEVDSYLCSLFKEDNHLLLEAKLSEWTKVPYLAKREQITQECLWAHKQAKYTLCIPSLLAIVDGLTRTFLKDTPTAINNKKKKRTTRVKDFSTFYKTIEPALWGESFTMIVDDLIFQNFRFGSKKPRTSLNRHGIMHGDIFDYGTEANSLKLFLLVDTIQHFIRSYNEKIASQSQNKKKQHI